MIMKKFLNSEFFDFRSGFDVSRLVKPDRHAILEKLTQSQRFGDAGVDQATDKKLAASTDQVAGNVPDADKAKHVKTANQDLQKFEENVLAVLREFDQKPKTFFQLAAYGTLEGIVLAWNPLWNS